MNEPETYDKNGYLERNVDLIRAQIIRESYEKMPENVILSGTPGLNSGGINGKIRDLFDIKAANVNQIVF